MPAPAKPPTKSTILLFLVGIVALAAGLRALHLVELSRTPLFAQPMIDGQAYHDMARTIIAGTAPARPFYQDPLYPYLLAAIFTLFGQSFLAVYLVQLLFALIFVVLAFDTARILFDWRAGLLAALAAALYRPFIFHEGVIDKTALSVFLVGVSLWTLVRGLKSKAWAWPVATGIALGLAALTRANLLLCILPPAIAFAARRRFFGLLLFSAGLALVIAPVSIRNSVLARELTLTTTQAGQNLYIGNAGHNRTGQYEAPPWVRPNPLFEETDFRQHAEAAAGRALTPAGVSRYYVRATWQSVTATPARWAGLMLRKVILFLNNFEVPDNYDIEFYSRQSAVLRLPLLGFGVVLGLGLAGMLLFGRRGAGHLALGGFFGLYALSTVLFFVLDRYRLPVVAALLPFAAAAPLWIVDRFRARRLRPALGGLALVVGCSLLSAWPVRRPGNTTQAQSLVNLAAVRFSAGDTVEAVRLFEQALAVQPGHAEASRNLGIILYGRGDIGRSAELLGQARKADSTNPMTRYYLGMVSSRLGQFDSAAAEFAAALRLRPGEPRYRFELATVLQRLGRYAEALAHYDTIRAADPDNPLVFHNRAVALYSLGRYAAADSALAVARRLGGPVNPEFERRLAARQPPGR